MPGKLVVFKESFLDRLDKGPLEAHLRASQELIRPANCQAIPLTKKEGAAVDRAGTISKLPSFQTHPHHNVKTIRGALKGQGSRTLCRSSGSELLK